MEEAYSAKDVLVWDLDDSIDSLDKTILLWKNFSDNKFPNAISIPHLIEVNSDAIRSRYLAWIFELGELKLNGKPLVDHLQLRSNFSYWWMSLFIEKSNYSKSPQINDAIRFLAFTEWASEHSIFQVTLASNNESLAECMSLWCNKRKIKFIWKNKIKYFFSVKKIFEDLLVSIKSLIWLPRYLINRWPLRRMGLKAWNNSNADITIVNYLDNCSPEAFEKGFFDSNYWAHLPGMLKEKKSKINWLHFYVKDNLMPTAKHAAKALSAFNKSAGGWESHVTLDSFISFNVIIRTLWDWLQLKWLGITLKRKVANSILPSPNLWPMLSPDWRESMFGKSSMENCLHLSLLEVAFACIPKQRRGLYLQENQGWEFGLIASWRSQGHGKLIGVPHSTVRFWDLRYFFDQRSYLQKSRNALPLPDAIATNGPMMLKSFETGGYPTHYFVDVEALRYLYLEHDIYSPPPKKDYKNMCLLVLGEYSYENTKRQMNLLANAYPFLPKEMIIIVKSHPNCPINAEDYPGLKMLMTMEPISKLLPIIDIAYSSAVTSASVDVYCAGVPVVSMLDPRILNLSPIRGCPGVKFASTPEDLVIAIMDFLQFPSVNYAEPVFFNLDNKLLGWEKLLLL